MNSRTDKDFKREWYKRYRLASAKEKQVMRNEINQIHLTEDNNYASKMNQEVA